MSWLSTLSTLELRGQSCVLVTVTAVRGHAPRAAGAKMVVTLDAAQGSVGGGNLEQRCIVRARELLAGAPGVPPETLTVPLTLRHSGQYGVQCCGGEVTVVLERLDFARPQVAIFGAGHVGLALARVLGTLPLEIVLVDSRAGVLSPAPSLVPTLPGDADSQARVRLMHKPFPEYPEQVVAELRPGACVVILTHDHAEDLVILERCLGREDLGYLGLIGSSVKWVHFRERLKAEGVPEDALERVTTPIGVPGIAGKQPEVIAIAVAAQLLMHLTLPEF